RDPGEAVDLAFVQGGASEATGAAEAQSNDEAHELVSLGTLSYDPVWIFYREAARELKGGKLESLTQLRGWKVNVGGRGSGSPGLMSRLLGANGVERDELERSNFDETAAVMALLEGTVDASVLVSPPE